MNITNKRQRDRADDINLLSQSCPSIFDNGIRGTTSSPKRELNNMPFMIGVSGGSASGKTTVCDKILSRFNDRVMIISLDSFYKPLSHNELDNVKNYNFDHPDAFDWELVINILKKLKKRKNVDIPQYDFNTHSRTENKTTVLGVMYDVIILEGILMFHNDLVRNFFDMKIFVDTDSDTRLARRVVRDMEHRGRSLESILHQYETFVKPSFDNYILPTKKFADIIIPRGGSNIVAIDLIEQHISSYLKQKKEKRKRDNILLF